MDSILGLAKTEGMLFKYGSGTGSNLSGIRSSKEPLAGGGTASGPVSFMRGYDAFAGVIKSGGKTRRAAKMVILNADHPDIEEFINCKAEEERKAWALIDAGYDGAFNVKGGAYDSVFFQNANHSVRVTDDFMRAVLEDRDWSHALRAHGRGLRHLQGARPHEDDVGGGLAVRRPGHAVRHHHQRLAHLPQHGPDQRQQSLQRVPVPGRHGLQPGLAEPDEVRQGRRRVRHRGLRGGLPHHDHGAGDPGRQRQLPDAGHRPQQPRLPAAGPGLREPGRAAHGPRPALRLRRRPRLRGHHHRDHARRGLRAERAHRRGHGPLRRLRRRTPSPCCA